MPPAGRLRAGRNLGSGLGQPSWETGPKCLSSRGWGPTNGHSGVGKRSTFPAPPGGHWRRWLRRARSSPGGTYPRFMCAACEA